MARARRPTGAFRVRRGATAALLGLASALGALPSAAASDDILVERTRPAASVAAGEPASADPELYVLMQRVDTILHEAVQDLGLTLDLSEPPEPSADEEALIRKATDHWVLGAELGRSGRRLKLRITLVPPGSNVVYVRTQTLAPDELEMRVVLMARDLVEAARGRPRARSAPVEPQPVQTTPPPPHSPGRAILALNAALLGGYAGYSLQEASGSDDERLTYPLVALGAGVGLGGSMLVADEWNIGVGDAWFLSAGVWWPTLSGILLARSYDVETSDRYAYGLLGATAGLTLTTTVLGFRHVTEGGAALAHSGGAFGTLLGALAELTIEGSTTKTPHRGMGFGAGGGFLLATALLTQVEPSASRVLLIDLAASLGALTGAAAGSPLLLVEGDEVDANRNRLWLASVAAGTIAGGLLGYLSTRPETSSDRAPSSRWVLPSVGLVGMDAERPAFGASVSGTW